MAPRDAEKIVFKTPIGNFYYTVMHFGLKNASAPYQQTMTAIFHYMMHWELEDYVDDIVMKWKKREEHVQVLRRVFERCRAFKLKKNPFKCEFGVSFGKFLYFLVHSRGIDVDPVKTMAIATMKLPTTVKELKSFLGKVSYIWRFIPWHQLLLLSLDYSKRGKALCVEKHNRRPSKGYNILWWTSLLCKPQSVKSHYCST